MARSARAVTVTLYRAGGAALEAPQPPPVSSNAVCVAAFGVIATIAAALGGTVYLLLGAGTGLRHL